MHLKSKKAVPAADCVKWMKLSASAGYQDAMFCTSLICLHRADGYYDYELASAYMGDLAQRGEIVAEIMFQAMEALGECDLEDIDNYLANLFQTDCSDYGAALLKMGDTYMDQKASYYNPKIAFRLYTESSEMGVSEAMRRAGHMYESGVGIRQSYDDAIRCYEDAVKHGDAAAEQDLSNLRTRMAT